MISKLQYLQNLTVVNSLKSVSVRNVEYTDALKLSKRGKTVFLSRKSSEKNINECNSQLLRALEGNIVQYCLDPSQGFIETILRATLKKVFGRYHHLTFPYRVSVTTMANDICRP